MPLHNSIESVIEDEKHSEAQQSFDALSMEAKFERLKKLVQQSQVYSQVMLENMMERNMEKRRGALDLNEDMENSASTESIADVILDDTGEMKSLQLDVAHQPAKSSKRTSSRTRAAQNRNKKKQKVDPETKHAQNSTKEPPVQSNRTRSAIELAQTGHKQQQPSLISGCIMKSYQLDGLEWLVSLYENGLNGILADEMGLGKTLQCIALFGYLMEHGIKGPFLVVAPLSTVSNWCMELNRFAPSLSVLKYVGDKNTRARIKLDSNSPANVVVTSYEMIIRDFPKFAKLNWEYLTVDEGHRLKNFQSVLIRCLKKLLVGNRLLLTGTPLQNNLKELWSLLNFILPDIFQDLDLFESWFDFDKLKESNDEEIDDEESKVLHERIQKEFVKHLHSILQPFLLRRVKESVIKDLPPKKEYIIYTELTPIQNIFYKAVSDGVLNHTIVQLYLKEYLLQNHKDIINDEEGLDHVDQILRNKARPTELAARKRVTYFDEIQSDEFDDSEIDDGDISELMKVRFAKTADTPDASLNSHSRKMNANPKKLSLEEMRERVIIEALCTIERHVKNFLLQNGVMQLRSICASHYIYYEPFSFGGGDDNKYDDILASLFLENSGKAQLLEQLTAKLLKKKHKILIFSQFTKVLDLIAIHYKKKGIRLSRLDGRMDQDARTKEIELFSSEGKESSQIFLLSTRAGGLGLNLTHADTVILFDNDWNPQMDLQAIDRVHRIGQIRPVKVFRFVVRDSIEELLIIRSFNKRALEKLVIEQGNFQLGLMAKKLAAENIDMSTIKSFGSILDLGRRLNALGSEPSNSSNVHCNAVLLGKARSSSHLLDDEEFDELLDRSTDCYSRKAHSFRNIIPFETTNNMDK